jgi:hypothetical protein
MKVAIFVEGQTELVFVREYLLKMFDYQNISIECNTLFNDFNLKTTEYPFPNENATHHFDIYNAGNDNALLSRILRREQYLWNEGFNQIIGLRDMYSKQYREVTKHSVIDEEINQEFISGVQKEINKQAKKPENIHFHFAIMEAESWILGFHSSFTELSAKLTSDYIKSNLGFDLKAVDPETTFFHPAKTLQEIYKLIDENYNKSKGNIEAIMSRLCKEDFEKLSKSGKCKSFDKFHRTLASFSI